MLKKPSPEQPKTVVDELKGGSFCPNCNNSGVFPEMTCPDCGEIRPKENPTAEMHGNCPNCGNAGVFPGGTCSACGKKREWTKEEDEAVESLLPPLNKNGKQSR